MTYSHTETLKRGRVRKSNMATWEKKPSRKTKWRLRVQIQNGDRSKMATDPFLHLINSSYLINYESSETTHIYSNGIQQDVKFCDTAGQASHFIHVLLFVTSIATEKIVITK